MSDLCPVAVSQEPAELEEKPKTAGEAQLLLLKQQKYCDVTFTFPNLPDRIQAHELLLKARSSVFEQIFRMRKSGNVQGNEIEMSESTPERVQQFLEFIYADQFEVDMAAALDLLQLAQKYKIQLLTDKCEELLKTEIEFEKSVQVFQAARRYGRQELMDRAGEIMVKSLRSQNLTEMAALLNAEEETVIYLLERDDLSVKEAQLFDFTLGWGMNQVGTSAGEQILRDKLKNVISKIRYTNMTPREFTAVVVPTGLLSAEETVSVYSYLCGDKGKRRDSKIKFNTTSRSREVETMDKLVNFYTDVSSKSIWSAAVSKQCISFKAERTEAVTAGLAYQLIKKAVITGIRLKSPNVNNLYKDGINLNFSISIREFSGTGTENDKNFTIRFHKTLLNLKGGGIVDLSVEPPVELVPGKMFSIIVEDLSTSNTQTSFRDKYHPYFGEFLGTPKTDSNNELEAARLVLKEIMCSTEYYSGNRTNPSEYIAMITRIRAKLVE